MPDVKTKNVEFRHLQFLAAMIMLSKVCETRQLFNSCGKTKTKRALLFDYIEQNAARLIAIHAQHDNDVDNTESKTRVGFVS